MRFALVCTAVLLFTGVRAHADTIANIEVPHAASFLPFSSAMDETGDDSATPQLVLSDVRGTELAVGVSSSASVTPEPASLLLMGSGALFIGGLAWRRRRSTERVASSERLASAV